jgi:hypothetical protein
MLTRYFNKIYTAIRPLSGAPRGRPQDLCAREKKRRDPAILPRGTRLL